MYVLHKHISKRRDNMESSEFANSGLKQRSTMENRLMEVSLDINCGILRANIVSHLVTTAPMSILWREFETPDMTHISGKIRISLIIDAHTRRSDM
jgi:hypothetical protein